MAEEKKKLDSLCHLIDKIMIEHNNVQVPKKDIAKCPQKQTLQKNQPKNSPQTTPVKSVKNEGKNREEIELERKARKEAKKAKKKGGDGKEDTKQQQPGMGKTEEKEVMKETSKQQKTVKADKGKPLPSPAHVLNKKEENKQKTTKEQVQEKQQQIQGLEVSSDAAAGGKSKAELKRERREKQEAQRQAKMAAKAKAAEEKQPKKKAETQSDKKSSTAEKKKKGLGDAGKSGKEKSGDKKLTQRRIPLLGHLTPPASQTPHAPVNCEVIHPAVRTLGIKMKASIV